MPPAMLMDLPGAVNARKIAPRAAGSATLRSMATASLLSTLVMGFALGLRHALDADHVAAVAALAGGRDGMLRTLRNGLSWGTGHALMIGAAGGTLVALRVVLPAPVALLSEALVAAMLVALGAGALLSVPGSRLHAHEHEHDGVRHAHLHFHPAPHGPAAPHRHPHPMRLALRPFLVGGVHGLAGSSAAALLVITTIPTLALGCVYLGVFGIGTIAGMALMSLVLGAPLWLARRRAGRVHAAIRAVAGAVSLGLGLELAWRLGAARWPPW